MKYGLDDDGVFRIEAPILPTSEDLAINAPINKNYQMHDDLLMTQKSQRLDTSSTNQTFVIACDIHVKVQK